VSTTNPDSPLLPVEHPDYWRARWREQRTGWDLGGQHPMLAPLISAAASLGFLKAGAKIWVPGAGRAHDAAALALQGFQVHASDVAEQAVDGAKALYDKLLNLTIAVEDALSSDIPDTDLASYDAVFDRAVLCALPPEARVTYVAQLRRRLKPRGLFLTLAFTKTKSLPGSPPFGIPVPKLVQTLAGFSLIHGHEYLADEAYGTERSGAIESEIQAIFVKSAE